MRSNYSETAMGTLSSHLVAIVIFAAVLGFSWYAITETHQLLSTIFGVLAQIGGAK